MTTADTYAKLLAGLRLELAENDRDLRKCAARYDELMVERRKLSMGIYGIQNEMERLDDDN